MNKINDYKDLLVWQKAMNLAISAYKTTELLPKRRLAVFLIKLEEPQFLFRQI